MVRILVILLLFCFGCQTGRIPCPKFKGAKSGHHKRYRNYSASLTAKADEKDSEIKVRKPTETRYVQNISVEEWDCPQPGSRKYLPRNVKENIRKNTRRVREDVRKVSADSTVAE